MTARSTRAPAPARRPRRPFPRTERGKAGSAGRTDGPKASLAPSSQVRSSLNDALTIRPRLVYEDPQPRAGVGPLATDTRSTRPAVPVLSNAHAHAPQDGSTARRETANGHRIGSDRDDRQPPEPGGLSKKALARHVRRVPRYRPPRTQGHPDGLPARLRHDPQSRDRGDDREQGKTHPLQVLRRPREQRPGRHLRPGKDAHQPGQHPHERRAAVRDRAQGVAPARPGRQLQEHDRPAPEEGAGGVLQVRRGGGLHLRLARGGARRRRRLRRLPDARGAAPPDPRRAPPGGPRTGQRRRRGGVRLPRQHRGRPLPVLPPDVQRADGQVRRRLGQGPGRHPGPPPDPLRARPRRHRHVPAQGREEPGRHRADRRHQLPQDRRVRHRERPQGLQFRRRVQHRQPRHHRVHRGPQARRRLPLRPPGRQPGAQDQAQEVRADRHRRGHPRAHQRARVQEAPVQRVHGGAPRPHGQDRRPLRHPALRRDPHLREGLQRPQGPRQADRARTRSKSPRCGPS